MDKIKLEKIVKEFKEGNFKSHLQEQFLFYHSLEIEEAIDNAVFGRYIGKDCLQYFSSHFKYFLSVKKVSNKNVWQLKKLLYPARIALNSNRNNILKSKSFLDLYMTVRNAININGLADLFYYDVSLRLGNSKPFEDYGYLMPQQIFIQAGAKKGAAALLGEELISQIPTDKPYLSPEYFEKFTPISSLEPYLVECFLCIKKEELSNLKVC